MTWEGPQHIAPAGPRRFKPRGVAAGTAAERAVQHDLEAKGWTVGSRRHIGGPGDILAVRRLPNRSLVLSEILLIEVKSTTGGPFHSFGPDDRRELHELATHLGARPLLAWKPPRSRKIQWFGPEAWPTTAEGPVLTGPSK